MKALWTILVAFVFVASVFLPATAAAVPGPIELVSKNAKEQADVAMNPAISADGRYVVFQGIIVGLKGIFRKDLATGELAPVAVESAYPETPYTGPGAAKFAESPSVSADGRYVAFTTSSPLVPADTAGSSAVDKDVYVADMSAEPPTYELASAINGSEEGIAYAPEGGSFAAAKVALSADGREVAFTIDGASDLLGEAEGTPSGQVVVRNLTTHRTTLVSVERDAATGAMTERPVAGGAVSEAFGRGASISADGSTVAWLGQDIQEQVPMAQGEPTFAIYDEPLWRRIADGPGAPTRRIVGGGDPLAPGCPAGGSITESACQGPFPRLPTSGGQCESSAATGWAAVTGFQILPQLSADGDTVALIGSPNLVPNLFLVDMDPGLDRKEAVQQITHELPLEEPCEASHPNLFAGDAYITDVAISSNGEQIAFTTQRQRFPQSSLNLLTAPPSAVGGAELYLIDAKAETLQRLTPRQLGEPSLVKEGAGANAPSFGDEGQELSFASTASNLVVGDANEHSDAFVISVPEVTGSPGSSQISPSPAAAAARRSWRLTASAVSLPDGQVCVRAITPGTGKVRGQAKALVGAHLGRRKVAAGGARGQSQGVVKMDLRLAPRFRSLAKEQTGLEAVVKLQFHSREGPDLSAVLPVRFRVHPKHSHHQRGHQG